MLVQVHCLDRYEQKWPKMLVWVHDLDRYEHPYHLKPGKTEKASRNGWTKHLKSRTFWMTLRR